MGGLAVFKKILIANRGEIACRIARTCRRLGVAVAGVHSRADSGALHVKTIGESIEIGGAPAAESYLRIDAVIAAAKATGAQAIHPGFGFLAENAAFARAVEAAGLVFIGPAPETIERLGDKASAKQEADAAGVPTVPGSKTPSEDPPEIAKAVRDIGLPVMLKAAAGGGGKGMRAIATLKRLDDEIGSAMREARSAFGSAGLIVEKLVEHGRHIEVQIAGDGAGNVIHLFERECSLQRRHQKLIEEAPAANLSAAMRENILADAVRLGQRLNYRGVGTVEFIVEGDRYYFLEVNPRLQVEHPVTEMVTGLDIVELMLRIAAGEGLAVAQQDIVCTGHSVEARICAEDASENFLPSTGTLSYVCFPASRIRVETGVETGSQVTPYYDSMVAKLITHGETRDSALDQLDQALRETSIFGVTTNQAFLRRLIALPETQKGQLPHAPDRRATRCPCWRGRETLDTGLRACGAPLDDRMAQGSVERSVVVGHHDGLAHGQRRCRALADSSPASRSARRERGDSLLAAPRGRHDADRGRRRADYRRPPAACRWRLSRHSGHAGKKRSASIRTARCSMCRIAMACTHCARSRI